MPCVFLGESSLAVVPLSDIVSFPAFVWAVITCSMSSVLKLGVVLMFALALFQSWLLPGFMRYRGVGRIFFPATLFGSDLASASLFLESLPRGVSEVSGRCPCYLPLPYCEIPLNTKCTCVYDRLTSKLSPTY